MSTFTFRVDEEILNLMKKYPEINWSKEIREFVFNRAADESLHHPFAQESVWRTTKYNDTKITVNAKLGEFGPTGWSLEITEPSKGTQVIELGGMPWVEKIIRGVSDYYYHEALISQGKSSIEIASIDSLSDLWLALAKWARRYCIELSANVALLSPQSIRVHGVVGQSDFNEMVTPKDWGEVKKVEDHINVFFSNFWLGSYKSSGGTVFRLSSYLTENLNITSKKSATRYVDLNPEKEEHAKEIKRILTLSSVIYLPDISIKNVHSVFSEQSQQHKSKRINGTI